MTTESKAREILGAPVGATVVTVSEAVEAIERALAQPVVDEAMVERDRWVRAWRNRFISERMNSYPDDEYELRTAKAEADANEFEAALEKAFESRAALTAAHQKEG